MTGTVENTEMVLLVIIYVAGFHLVNVEIRGLKVSHGKIYTLY